jgi:hypothetical protein
VVFQLIPLLTLSGREKKKTVGEPFYSVERMFSKANESASGSENKKCNNSKEVISAMEIKGISKIGENSTEISFQKDQVDLDGKGLEEEAKETESKSTVRVLILSLNCQQFVSLLLPICCYRRKRRKKA